MDNANLREQAINAIANYMHHQLFDAGLQENMLVWLRDSASNLMEGCDKAISKTIEYCKQKGII